MNFKGKLIKGILIRRYKRFLADVQLENGEIILAHCTNSGSMKSCIEPGADVMLSPVDDPKRKTRYTWEMIKIDNSWVGVNTMNPNRLAFEEVSTGNIPGLEGYTRVQREVQFEDSRFDLMAANEHETCFIEVKNVTMMENGIALFPDAVTERGRKHLETLMKVKQQNMRAVMLYVIQRTDTNIFMPAYNIDPGYAATMKKAVEAGVEIIPLQVLVTPETILPLKILPLQF
jgi:sugar fermentation stimulation protein A